MWRSTIPLICFWLVEFHLPDHVLQQSGLKQEQPRDANTNRDLHKRNARGKVEKNWSVEHAVHIQKWNDSDEYVCNALRMEEVMSRRHHIWCGIVGSLDYISTTLALRCKFW